MNRTILMSVMVLFLSSLLFGCSSNKSDISFGKYEFEFPFLYTYPSSVDRVGYVTKGTDVVIEKNIFTIKQNSTGQILKITKPIYKFEKMNEKMIENLRKETSNLMGVSNLSKYKNKYCCTVYEKQNVPAHMFPYSPKDKSSAIISLYVMNDEIWLAPYWDENSSGSELYHKHDFIVRLKLKTN
jgi:hypothetical protein